MASRKRTNTGTESGKTELNTDTIEKLDQALQEWDNPTSEVRRRFEESELGWNKIVQPLVQAIGDSELLSEEDLAVRINTRD